MKSICNCPDLSSSRFIIFLITFQKRKLPGAAEAVIGARYDHSFVLHCDSNLTEDDTL